MRNHQKKTEEPASGYKHLQQVASTVSPLLFLQSMTAQLQGKKLAKVQDGRHEMAWEDKTWDTSKKTLFLFLTH